MPLSSWKLLDNCGSRGAARREHRLNGRARAAEPVRRWLLNELVESYRFPADWLGTRILLTNHARTETPGTDFSGIAVLLAGGQPFLLLSAQAPGHAAAAESVLRAAMLDSYAAGLGLSSDGSEAGTVFLRRRFDTAKCDYVADIEVYGGYQASGQTSTLFGHAEGTDDTTGEALAPITDRIGNLFFEVHSYIRDIDGLHADEALDELCKLLYAKLYDEETAPSGVGIRLHRRLYGTAEEMAAAARLLYRESSSGASADGGEHGDRPQGVFSSPMRLSSPALANAVEALQRFSLMRSDVDVKGRAFQRVLGPAMRSGMGQYFTPEPVIRFIVDVVDPQLGEIILDPFCGSGHFLSQCLEHVRSHASGLSAEEIQGFAFRRLHGIEKSDRMVRVAMTDMRLHGDGHSNLRCTDSLLDFLNYPGLEPESYDVILTNPPFGSLMTAEALARLASFELAKGKKTVPLEILGLERCLQFLRPGGRLAIVMPDSMLTNRGTRYVREWLRLRAKLRAIVSLPIETFCPFGANIKTSIMFLRRWERGEEHSADYPVALLKVDSVGYDSSGRPSGASELPDAVIQLRAFFLQEGW